MVPHVHWFPWARPRNKLEAALKFINVMRKRYGILIATDRESEPFFTHLVRYGVLRRIGTSRQWYSGKETPLFESVAPQNAGES